MTSFGNEQTAVAAMKAGAIDYLVKSPETFAQISHTISRALRAWNGLQERRRAEERLNETLQRLRQAVTSTIRVLGLTVEARDPYTAGHQQRTTKLAVAIAEELGLPSDRIEGLRLAGEIHDLGKISMPSEILSKPSRLTPFEFDLVKTHPRKGYGILKDVELPWPVAEIVYQHHERIDGSGYPRR
ncbi:MAG: HD domain-containing protein, partial [Candidatus Aminicenantes bacterium]|nr:HD domain-containing protein [Candidatus Aminicenantes bacterium]